MKTIPIAPTDMFDEQSVVITGVADDARPPNISKSKFVAGLQCLKRLYCQVFNPKMATQPSAGNFAIAQQGKEIGRLARQLFPGGVEVEADSENLVEAVRRTRELVANDQVPAIFEAAFEHGGVLVRVDILERREKNKWRLIEVKSGLEIGDHHLYDVAIQNRVVSRSGLKLSSSNLMHLNRNYVRKNGPLDLKQLFRIKNVNRQVERLKKKVATQLRTEFRILGQSHAPDIPVGPQCRKPVLCEFFDVCNPEYPADHVKVLPGIRARTLADLQALGVETVGDIPEDFRLTERQKRARASIMSGKLWSAPDLRSQLDSLRYPLCFMDFETVNPALPPFAGMRPYSYIPFQWSVHRQENPTSTLTHFEFLAEDGRDHRLQFLTSLLSAIEGAGTIVVYSQSFESGRLKDLSEAFPKYAKKIAGIKRKLWDLLPFLRKNVYHPEFEGSFSLKKVLPALVPSMTYEGMEVSDGAEAGLAWEKMRNLPEESAARNETRAALLAYCSQDTFAMVRLLDVLRSLSNAQAHKAAAQ